MKRIGKSCEEIVHHPKNNKLALDNFSQHIPGQFYKNKTVGDNPHAAIMQQRRQNWMAPARGLSPTRAPKVKIHKNVKM